MTTVGIGFAQSLETLLQRFPGLRDLGLARLRRQEEDQSPAALASIIESEIIPRLLIAHLPSEFRPMAGATPGDAEAGAAVGASDVVAFAARSLDHEVADLLEDVEAMLARGVPADSVLIDLLAPAARQLGVFWEEDRCDFVDVTMGLWRLQELTHEVASRLAPPWVGGARRLRARRAFFATVPGDQHQLGVILVSEFFRAAGWQVTTAFDQREEALSDAVASERYDLIGLTLTQDWQLDSLPPLIETLRARSRHPAPLIMVGGGLIACRPELAFLVGADATAPDARSAVERAEQLLDAFGASGARPS